MFDKKSIKVYNSLTNKLEDFKTIKKEFLMKTVFIINPKAGSGRKIKALIEDIKTTSDIHSLDTDIYITKSKLDAKRYVRESCEENDFVRFIACGGDGTLNEVINGAMGFENVEIGVLPVGTGNDFCRNFKDMRFKDILLQTTAKTQKCDAIKYTTKTKDGIKSEFCVNMINIGFDSNVVDMTDKIKKIPFISGSFAYIVAVFITLIKKRGANLKIALDGVVQHEGNLLLTSAANGRYCGGGFMSNPDAELNDGLISVNIIKDVSRLKFLKL